MSRGMSYPLEGGGKISEVEFVQSILSRCDTKITLRRLYYILASAELIPKTQKAYRALSDRLGRARLQGQMSKTAFVDLTAREYGVWDGWDSPMDMVMDMEYRSNWWAGAEAVPELWCEGAGTVAVLEPVAARWQVRIVPCGGKPSITMRGEAAERAARAAHRTEIGYLGDFDPSGMQIAKVLADTLADWSQDKIAVTRLGLNPDQTGSLTASGRPPKPSDPTTPSFISEYGNNTWELEAVPVPAMRRWAERFIAQFAPFDPDDMAERDDDAWAEFLSER